MGALFEHFVWAGQFAFQGSPLYQFLCRQIAHDAAVLELAGRCRSGEPPCFLFLGALHYLNFLPNRSVSLCGSVERQRQYRVTRELWLDNQDAITEVLRWRRVQTNEVGRSSLFALGAIVGAGYLHASELHHVDLGASVGLNLFWDRYDIKFSSIGAPSRLTEMPDPSHSSLLSLSCTVSGTALCSIPSMHQQEIRVLERVGIELAPLDRRSPDDLAWLRALVWSDQRERLRRFDSAIVDTAHVRHGYIAGDASVLLTEACDGLPPRDLVMVTHSYLMGKFSEVQQAALHNQLSTIAKTRPLIEVSVEYEKAGSQWSVKIWSAPGFRPRRGQTIASGSCHPHGDAIVLDLR